MDWKVSEISGSSLRAASEGRSVSHKNDDSRSRSILVPELFATQAATTPNAPAVIAANEVLTYGELSARANRIGRFLNSHGVRPDNLVAVCMERSTSMVAANLGALMAGAAYLPLDSSYPNERLDFMLNDAKPLVLLTQRHLAKRLPIGAWRTVILDADPAEIAKQSGERFDTGVQESNLAYVIYTSGSTGLPKGVEVTHGNLSNLVRWHQDAFKVQASDCAMQFSSPGFDAAVWEIWPYLTAGACVHVVDDAARSDAAALRGWMINQHISIGFVPTPLAERMIALDWPNDAALRVLLTGADTLHKYPPAGLPFTLVNNYGPTECAVVASSAPVPANEDAETQPTTLPAIGRPISNSDIYICSEKMERLATGEIGEIYVGGANVARGYLNRPELTRERFVANPFSSDTNARLYRTGDLGRYLPDGQIAFLGRIDDQIKIRGFRVEPNEIVSSLNEHSAVLNSAINARSDSAGDKYLVGYVVFTSDAQATATELQDFLLQRLPAHMIPSVFVYLESLPLTSSGKVDRNSLPAPDSNNTLVDAIRSAPQTFIECGVAGILAKLLNAEEIGLNDNFFLLGGHSLLAAQIIGSIRETFSVEFPLRTIFDSPTVAELSDQIEKALAEKVEAMSPEEVRRALAASQG
jgi:amino acid adenylation domain-containing protein